jgi:diguanylate cyclase (GGDEF)-like protein/PAS domain S-box-containing protein
MFFHGKHKDLIDSIEAIGASFAVYEFSPVKNTFFLISCNTMYEELLGIGKAKVINQSISSIFPRYLAQPLVKAFNKCITEQIANESEILIEYKATERWWRSILSPIIDLPDDRIRIIQTCVEITEKKALEKQLNITMKRYEAVVQTAYDGIITIDENQKIKLINNAAQEIFCINDDDVVGLPLTNFIPQKYRKKHVDYVEGFKKSLVDSRPMQSRASVRGLRKDGTEFSVEITISKIKVEDNIEMTAVIRDISEKNKLLEELLLASQEDHLTHLYNRNFFSKRLVEEIARSKRFQHGFTLMMLDIDHFKKVNDTYGHDCGDKVLIRLASILTEKLRGTDVVCRWGGEEFLILLPESTIETGTVTAEKIRTEVEASEIQYDCQLIKITCSIGIHFCSYDDIDFNEILLKVDKAMYQAKQNGRNQIALAS